MSQLDRLIDEFDPKVIRRGDDYFRRGAVTLARRTPTLFETRVAGNETYTVRIEADAQGVTDFSCTCPYGSDYAGACKHVWASLLMAEARNWEGLGKPLRDKDQDPDLEDVDDNYSESDPDPLAKYPSVHTPWGTYYHPHAARSREPSWRQTLQRARESASHSGAAFDHPAAATPRWPPGREVTYVVDLPRTLDYPHHLVLEVLTRDPKSNGKPGKWKRARLTPWDIAAAPDPDRLLLQMLAGCSSIYGDYDAAGAYSINPAAYDTVLRPVCETGRCAIRHAADASPFHETLSWDAAPDPWRFHLSITEHEKHYRLTGLLRRGDADRMPLTEPALVLRPGLLIARNKISRADWSGAFDLLATLREYDQLKIPTNSADDLLRDLYALPRLPPTDFPASLQVEEIHAQPQPVLRTTSPAKLAKKQLLQADLSFDYAGHLVPYRVDNTKSAAAHLDLPARKVILRDRPAESAAADRLTQLGFRTEYAYGSAHTISRDGFPWAAQQLVRDGWRVEGEGAVYHPAGAVHASVTSGIDWFDLTARVTFGDQGQHAIPFPRLLEAIERGQHWVALDDGHVGLLPQDWLAKYAPLAALARESDAPESLRFSRAQAGLLDALLASLPDPKIDETFAQARQQLADFDGIRPAAPPKSFTGQLRPYQKDALGWLNFLNRFSFGGCLADDMGLGKTVEVLALLESRRAAGHRPSLVVVPRSLIFNWKQEAARFTPKMRVLDLSTPDRAARTDPAATIATADLVLATYGTLRRDVARLKDVDFDYAILDESQAIKNATTQSAKAARLLRARHRLAMSGTPIENRLAELWSLFEFLNPGMLGSAGAFRALAAPSPRAASNPPVPDAPQDPTRNLLSKALRPFILRRTKQQVAKDLPDKLEQTIYCELDPPQRKLYDELRDHYRQALLGTVDKLGINRARIQILEALLRLRQAACHPALIDKSRVADTSAKLESLRANLAEVLAENHKALVFSQFTSFLALVRADLDAAKTPYEYLDGKTRDRQSRVDRFQSDPSCKLFLISLKAGGVGLNLTAADYVFLLDPWWNPAVEAQAVDRSHRIGQSKPVFAYRLIAKDTVEEKVLALQQSKRALADAILTQDNALLSTLTRQDLDLLLT